VSSNCCPIRLDSLRRTMTANDRQPAAIAVRMLDGAHARDARLADDLTSLVNSVYASSESGLWRDGVSRTTTSELADLIHAGQIAIATRDEQLAGSVRIRDIADNVSEFGMLVADPAQRGSGVGSALVEFAEQRGRRRGLRAIRLELLVPRGRRHPSKEFLAAWYDRIGYRRVRTETIEDTYPQLVPLLAIPCDLATYEKSLSR
jgi:GNAT superfamily N-acetyltransferase